ncbi:MAG: family intrarane metalloprotease protein [Caulobacteraceae bacterium]|nr:family intrarane metalloprotease protein [Caulobacteraceae bacterium]
MSRKPGRPPLETPFLADQTPRDASWWRLLLCLPGGLATGVACLVALVAILVAVFFVLILGHAVDRGAFVQMRQILTSKVIPPTDLAANLSVICLLAALNMALFCGFVGFAALIYQRRLLSYWTAARRFRWRLLLLGLGFFLLVLGPPLYFTRDLGSAEPSGPMPMMIVAHDLAGRITFVLITTFALLVAAAAEEVLFRGWLLRHVSAILRNPWIGVVVGSLLFSAAHADFNPDAFLERAVMGMGLCYSAMRLGGVEFPLGIHAGNNILIVLLIEPLKLTPEPPHPWNWIVLPALVSILLGYVALTELVVRWERLARWARVEITPPRALEFE